VGYSLSSNPALSAPYAALWNGTTWTEQTTQTQIDRVNANLTSVSCQSSSNCMAVGSDDITNTFGSGGNLLAEHWNGTSWTIDGVTTPASDLAPALSGVSCPSAKFCMAVGDYYTTLSNNSLTGLTEISETWNGAAWTLHNIVQTAGGDLPYGVSCTASNACTAAGSFVVPTNTGGTAFEGAQGWNGTKWTTETTVEPGDGYLFYGISCTAPTTCTGVGVGWGTVAGSNYPFTLAETE
jgi:hypothetical protein